METSIKRSIAASLLAVAVNLGLFAADPVNVKVFIPTGAPGIASVKLAVEKPLIAQGYSVEYNLVRAADLLGAKIINGEADIAIVPTNLAATLFNRGIDIRLLAPIVWGIQYGISATPLADLQSLKGKEIYSLGRGLTPDITFRYILSSQGIDPDKDVTIKYVSEAAELAPAFLAGKATVAIVPEPMVSTILAKKPSTQVFLDVQKEWQTLNGGDSSYPQASLIVKASFLRDNPAFVKAFAKALADSLVWINANPAKAGDYAFSLMPETPAAIVASAIPRLNLRYQDAIGAKKALNAYLTTLFKYSPDTVGGKLPADSLFAAP